MDSHLPTTCLACWRHRRVFIDIIKAFVVELVIVVGLGEEVKILVIVALVHHFHF